MRPCRRPRQHQLPRLSDGDFPDDRRPAYSAYFNALASPAALLPLLGAAIADLISLEAVFALAIAAAAIQLGLLPKLRTARES